MARSQSPFPPRANPQLTLVEGKRMRPGPFSHPGPLSAPISGFPGDGRCMNEPLRLAGAPGRGLNRPAHDGGLRARAVCLLPSMIRPGDTVRPGLFSPPPPAPRPRSPHHHGSWSPSRSGAARRPTGRPPRIVPTTPRPRPALRDRWAADSANVEAVARAQRPRPVHPLIRDLPPRPGGTRPSAEPRLIVVLRPLRNRPPG